MFRSKVFRTAAFAAAASGSAAVFYNLDMKERRIFNTLMCAHEPTKPVFTIPKLDIKDTSVFSIMLPKNA